MTWKTISAPPGLSPPETVRVRSQSIPARHYFAEHAHLWNQLVYAVAGVLTVTVEGRSFVISPEQAVWLPTGVRHRVGSLLGAEFRSLWLADETGLGLPKEVAVLSVSPLLRELIIEAALVETEEDTDGYAGRVVGFILDQLRRAHPLPGALPWPRGGALSVLCEALYANPADPRGPDGWCRELGLSARTLARRFDAELGMNMRAWRGRLRLFKAVEFLGGGLSVTQAAFELGYSSTSAFIFAFRTGMGRSPTAYMHGRKQPSVYKTTTMGSEGGRNANHDHGASAEPLSTS